MKCRTALHNSPPFWNVPIQFPEVGEVGNEKKEIRQISTSPDIWEKNRVDVFPDTIGKKNIIPAENDDVLPPLL